MEQLLESPPFWVAIAFVLFVVGVYKPISRAITKSLDARAGQIEKELAEATRLREEAAAVLASYQKKQRESLQASEAILTQARREAAQLQTQAQAALKNALEQRTKQAMDKIAQAEAKALKEVQHHLVDIAISAARSIITQHLDKASAEELISRAITNIERKIH